MTEFEFHHLGVAVPDIAKAIPLYAKTLGFRLASGRELVELVEK